MQKFSWTHPIQVTKPAPIITSAANSAPVFKSQASLITVYPGQKTVLMLGQLSDMESPKNITLTEIEAKCKGANNWLALPSLNEATTSLSIGVDVP